MGASRAPSILNDETDASAACAPELECRARLDMPFVRHTGRTRSSFAPIRRACTWIGYASRTPEFRGLAHHANAELAGRKATTDETRFAQIPSPSAQRAFDGACDFGLPRIPGSRADPGSQPRGSLGRAMRRGSCRTNGLARTPATEGNTPDRGEYPPCAPCRCGFEFRSPGPGFEEGKAQCIQRLAR